MNGTQFEVSAGTLSSTNATGLGSLAKVDVADGATFSVGASQIIGQLTDSTTTANTAAVSIGSGFALTVGNSSNNLTSSFTGVISGLGGLTKANTTTMTLSNSNSYTGATSVNEGTLLLDMNALSHPTGVLASTSALNLGGGELLVKGANSGSSSQTLGNFTLNNGGGKNAESSLVTNNNGGSGTTLTLGTITPPRWAVR